MTDSNVFNLNKPEQTDLLAAHGIYRTCFQGRIQPEALDIHLPKTAWRSKIASVAALSPAGNISLTRFIPSLCHRSGDARVKGEYL